MSKLIIQEQMPEQNFNCIAVANLDFSTHEYESCEYIDGEFSETPYACFDLASITKPLTLASNYIVHTDLFDDQMKLLLNHEAGLPIGGRITKEGWRDYIASFPIVKSSSLYSDYSALRLMLELEKSSNKTLEELCSVYLNDDIIQWMNIPQGAFCPPTGHRNKNVIIGEVHDPNCFNLKEYVSHAGLFATIDALAQQIIDFDKKFSLIKRMDSEFETNKNLDRFILGWDRVQIPEVTLAGSNHSMKTFGHLGFTGTSIWIDIEMMKGQIILTNATKEYWYSREKLNNLRRELGSNY